MERVIGNERVMDEKKGMQEVWRKQEIRGERVWTERKKRRENEVE